MTSGLALCSACMSKADVALTYLPVYFRNLDRWQPGRTGARQVPGSRVLFDGDTRGGDRIGRALEETLNALNTWARVLTDDRPYLARLYARLGASHRAGSIDDVQAVAWLCRGFDRWLTSVATLGWCGEFVRELDHLEHRLQTLSLDAVPGWYAGACRRCGTPTFVLPGVTWVTCRSLVLVSVDENGKRTYKDVGCGATTYARDHLEVVLDEARSWVAPPKRLAEAVVALIDTEQSVTTLYERIKKWQQRGRIECVDSLGYTRELDYAGERYAPRRSRLGDVLDALAEANATRTSARSKAGG